MTHLLRSIIFVVCLVESIQPSFLYRRDDLPTNELDNNDCNPLESLIEQLVESPGIQVILDFTEASMPHLESPKTSDGLFKLLKATTGLDPRDHHVRHAIACALYGVKSLNDLAALIGVPLDEVEKKYIVIMDVSRQQLGDADYIITLLNVFMQYNTWMVNTGFPTIPLKGNLTYNDIRDQMQIWQEAVMKKNKLSDDLADTLGDTMSPLRFTPDFTAAVLTGAPYLRTEDVMEKLCIKESAYPIIQKFVTPKNIEGVNDFIGTVSKIIKEIDEMGLFNLKRE